MQGTFLIHCLVTLCGVLYCDAELNHAQNPFRLDDRNIHNSEHDGDKKSVLEDSSFREVYDNANKEYSNGTASYAMEVWTSNSLSLNAEETEEVNFSSNDDSTITSSENPAEETTSDYPDTSETTNDGSTTDDSTTITVEQTTPDESTSPDADKGKLH